MQFDVISTCKSVFQRLQVALAQQAHAILLSLKNVLMAKHQIALEIMLPVLNALSTK